jgi:hypothetical protein
MELTASQIYYRDNRDRLLAQAKIARKEYYERNKETIRAKNLEKYHAKRMEEHAEPGKRGRRAGTKFPDGYKKTAAAESTRAPLAAANSRADFVGALKSPDDPTDVIFEDIKAAL